ncbi:LOW QUALITY PROTEIN: hypothetical protein PHMEG_00035902 [Phytophthora megakarya]|uniref:MULE transposase domain-containing protein n=1 Tax=Phytophthora megakarya TaxID=4795 RepID=A0A225UN49_9STRA|nr:LOW QUALITY PROTEIN: hypothetical protein PHMEG_00035902 [Phytophthora megakarya]
MRYRLLRCTSALCVGETDDACPWRGKTVTCVETGVQSVYDFAQGVSSPIAKRLTPEHKEFCREMAANHLRPLRIRYALSRKFDTPLEQLPSLTQVQNFVNYYSRKYLDNHDQVDVIKAWVNCKAFTGSETETQPFTFGWETDSDAKLVVGNGSDANLFVIGVTTKAMLLRMNRPPESFVFHLDATYKTNQCDYPVVAVGISDSSRAFHLVALLVVSQETEAVFQDVLLALKRGYAWLARTELRVMYALADASQTQFKALQTAFGNSGPYQFLMCFFHVMEKVHKDMRGFPSGVAGMIVRDLYDMHFSRSQYVFVRLRDAALKRWLEDPSLVAFSKYMAGQWLYGRFCCWQAFATPSGFATTNNPVETFNASLKRDYTLRRRLKMGTLLQELSNCCTAASETVQPFHYRAVPAKTLMRRAADTRRGDLLALSDGYQFEPTCAGPPQVVRVLSRRPPRIAVAPNKRSEEGIAVSAQMGTNYARKEVEGQPWGGWPVNLHRHWCPCGYWFMVGSCVHVVFALWATAHVDSNGQEVLVSRRKRRRSANAGAQQGGRSRSIGPAHSFE